VTGWVRRQAAEIAAGLRQVCSAGFWRGFGTALTLAPVRLSDWLTGTEFRGHGAVDIAGPGEQMRLWCLTCNEMYPCARLVAMEQETNR